MNCSTLTISEKIKFKVKYDPPKAYLSDIKKASSIMMGDAFAYIDYSSIDHSSIDFYFD